MSHFRAMSPRLHLAYMSHFRAMSKLQRDADKYYQRLIAAPMIFAENSKEVEVIPYEHLWKIVIELLTMRHNGEI